MWWARWGSMLILAAAAACGGESDDDAFSGTTNPAFVGRWVGGWTSTGSFGTQTGTADLTIAPSGKMTGTMHNATLGADGTISANVDESGKLSGSYAYGGYKYTSAGQMVLQENGHLGGAVDTLENGKQVATSSFDLIKQ